MIARFESDSATVVLEEPEDRLSATTSTGSEGLRVALAREHAPRRHLGLWPALALSLVTSGATVPNEPSVVFVGESSVVFGHQRPARRRVTLHEARQIALMTLRRAEERWEKCSDREAAVFMSLYTEAWD